MALCPSSTAASKSRQTTTPGLQSRYPLHLIKKWSWVVFVMVLGTFPLPSEGSSADMERLKASVQSHGQSLRNMEHYLRKTNQFWNWYQSNHKRLNELLREDLTPRTWDGQIPDFLQLQMENMINTVKIQFEEKMEGLKEDLQAERSARVRLEEQLNQRIHQQNAVTSSLQKQLQEQEEMLQECKASIKSLEESNCTCSKIMGFVRNMAAQTNQSLDSMHDRHDKFEGLHKAQSDSSKEQLAALSAEMERQQISIQTVLALQNSTKLDEEIRVLKVEVNKLSERVNTQKSHTSMNAGSRIGKLETQVSVLQGQTANISPLQDNFQRLSSRIQTTEESLNTITAKADDFRQNIKTRLVYLESRIKDIAERPQASETHRLSGNSLPAASGAVDYSRSYSRINFPSGPDGRTDFPASPGYTGFHGAPGSTGEDGFTGSRGEPGRPGDPGSRGAPGTPGLRGTSGTPGNRGTSGAPGAPGLPGAPGAPGAPGPQGTSGALGEPGSRGSPGGYGARGNPGFYGTSGLPGETGIRGAPGAPGVPGESGAPGTPGPQGAPGEPGIRGSPGDYGTRGRPGYYGNSGLPGDTGSRGLQGPPGLPGSYGTHGLPGRQGYPGPAG